MAITTIVLLLTAACGSKPDHITTVDISQPTSTDADPALAGRATTRFGDELFAAIRADKNAVISPTSIAIALAMVEPGATGDGKTQLDHALHVEDAPAFHASMTALRRSLESAKAPPNKHQGNPGDLQIAIANATYMQAGYALRHSYIDALGQYYGPVLKTVDFAGHGDGAVHDINSFVDHGTRGHIKKVLDHVDPATVLALVNALYLKASWLTPFKEADTKREPFTRLDESRVTAPLMHGSSDASASGDGFVAARKLYTARLAADFVLPDTGRFDDVAGRLGDAFAQLGDWHNGTTLVVPKLTTSFQEEMSPALRKLGLKPLYESGNLLGIANDPALVLDTAIHATWLAMDEKGTEAAAVTFLGFTAVGKPLELRPPVPVVLDRPYFFRIVDMQTGATLFVGQVLDPTAG